MIQRKSPERNVNEISIQGDGLIPVECKRRYDTKCRWWLELTFALNQVSRSRI